MFRVRVEGLGIRVEGTKLLGHCFGFTAQVLWLRAGCNVDP